MLPGRVAVWSVARFSTPGPSRGQAPGDAYDARETVPPELSRPLPPLCRVATASAGVVARRRASAATVLEIDPSTEPTIGENRYGDASPAPRRVTWPARRNDPGRQPMRIEFRATRRQSL